MDVYNGKLGFRWNSLVRKFLFKQKQKKFKNSDITILCNNCTGGMVLHDFGIRFNTPTINLFFRGTDFFDFIEHLEYYLSKELKESVETNLKYPVGMLNGGDNYKNLEIHFLHYSTFLEAKKKWEERKKRINWDKIFLIWSFVGMFNDTGNEFYYERAQNLPIEKKVIFVNHPVDHSKYPSFFYIKGFEEQGGLGVLSLYNNFRGGRYYDQFDFVGFLELEN